MSRIEHAWQSRGVLACVLWPVSLFYWLLIIARRQAYRLGLYTTHESRLPVVVVGNVSVGGTGKTPLCAHLVSVFQTAGWHPAIVSRGYAGERHELPHIITSADLPAQVGDEPLMLYQQTGVPVCVCVHRALAVDYLANNSDVDIVFADDGLQHLAMARSAEIVVVDGARGFGNGWLLPAGPLREPVTRLEHADTIAVQAADELHDSLRASARSFHQSDFSGNTFSVVLSEAVALADGQRVSLDEFAGQQVMAIAGIGHPERFFDALRALGLQVKGVAKPDHHAYTQLDFEGHEALPILVTSKDAVKLRALGRLPARIYEVPTNLSVSEALREQIDRLELSLRVHRMQTA